MNAVEIEEAVGELAQAPFDPEAFGYDFLRAFGAQETTVTRLRERDTNRSDVPNGVLRRMHIHIATCAPGALDATFDALRASPMTVQQKARFVLATDGAGFLAEELATGTPPIAGELAELDHHFGFFLPLAGIATVAEVRNNPIDVKATGRLNKLYVELLRHNEEWAGEERRPDLNRFVARLIFCFFAEDTGIFPTGDMFTTTVRQMSSPDGSDVDTVLLELFAAMGTERENRSRGTLRPWADAFPYVNGGVFEGPALCPAFSRTARAYLLRAGELNWKTINPDIFGSMIQAVADDEERGNLGLHYTSVPNIEKVLNPLFLDNLREQLNTAGTSPQKLLNLRRRLTRIRVFDPACGSGNFLVIAYIRMREIEQQVIDRRRLLLANPDAERRQTQIQLTQFHGIEVKSFAAEIARLAMLIAEFQCDARMIDPRVALDNMLPLHRTAHIVCDNALDTDWNRVCPSSTGASPPVASDLGGPTGQLLLEGDGAAWEEDELEIYLCGNPPYVGSKMQTKTQKLDIARVFAARSKKYKTLDYVAGWFAKAHDYVTGAASSVEVGLVSTNSIAQGEQVAQLWPAILDDGIVIRFAHTTFTWRNLASHNAGVDVVIVGLSRDRSRKRHLYSGDEVREVASIGPYMVAMEPLVVHKAPQPLTGLDRIHFGNHPYYATSALIMGAEVADGLVADYPEAARFIKPIYGTAELVAGTPRKCVWVHDNDAPEAAAIAPLALRFETVRTVRSAKSGDAQARALADTPWRFRDQRTGEHYVAILARHSASTRRYLPFELFAPDTIASDAVFVAPDCPLWQLALYATRTHLVWIAAVCGRVRNDFRYSNTLGWNTFPLPDLTDDVRTRLSQALEALLLVRESYFPASIADLYDADAMPENLQAAHQRLDEIAERAYLGRRFRNDTERLEHLFARYADLVSDGKPSHRTAGTIS